MPRRRFKMTRVPAPEWAPTYARGLIEFDMAASKHGDAITEVERTALISHHDSILQLVDKLVERYATDNSYEDDFPQQSRLTGEFYIGSESYHRLCGMKWIQICVEARCIGTRHVRTDDYLGLHVWLRFDPKSGRLTNHRNTDSMVI